MLVRVQVPPSAPLKFTLDLVGLKHIEIISKFCYTLGYSKANQKTMKHLLIFFIPTFHLCLFVTSCEKKDKMLYGWETSSGWEWKTTGDKNDNPLYNGQVKREYIILGDYIREQSGRLVGTSIGAAAAPTLSTIPFVGWLAAGWVAMFGGNQGANIGGDMATGGKC